MPRANTVLGLAVCLVFPFLLYLPSLHAPFVFDDDVNIVNNPDIRSWEGASQKLLYPSLIQEKDRNYPARPVAFLTFMLNYRWNGLDPAGYRLVNIALHSAVTALVFLLLSWILLKVEGYGGLLWPLGAALLFAAHPVQTEVVAYISNRTDSLATLFYLLSLGFFILSSEKGAWIVASLLCMALSWFSKEIAVSIPAAALLLDWTALSGLRWRETARRKWLHAALWGGALALLIFRKYYFGRIGFLGKDVYEIWTAGSYFAVQVYVLFRYLAMLVIPSGQTIDHLITPYLPALGIKMVVALTGWALALILAAYWLLRRGGAEILRRAFADPAGSADPIGPSGSAAAATLSLRRTVSLAAFAALWFAVTLSPTSSFFPAYDAMVERRLYLPSIGFALACSLFYARASEAWAPRFRGVPAARLFAILLWSHVALLSLLTLQRNRLYLSGISIWEEAVRRYPQNARAHQNLGAEYYKAGNLKEALRHFLRVIEIAPGRRSAAAYNNLGNVYYEKGDFKLAGEYFAEAVSIDPNLPEAHRNLGDAAHQLNDYDLAEKSYRQAIELNGADSEAYNNLGLLYLERKKYPEAERQFFRAIESEPSTPDPFGNLGDLYAEAGFGEKALDAYRKAAERGSKDPELPSKIKEIQKYVDSLPKVIYKN